MSNDIRDVHVSKLLVAGYDGIQVEVSLLNCVKDAHLDSTLQLLLEHGASIQHINRNAMVYAVLAENVHLYAALHFPLILIENSRSLYSQNVT